MINKKILLSSLFLTLLVSDVQSISINYPSKKMLNRMDHITSLITTASFFSLFNVTNGSFVENMLQVGYVASVAMNAVVNVMALKYDKKRATLLKLSLPVAIPIALILKESKKEAVKNVEENMVFFSIIGNCVKNIWDIYSLAGDSYSSIRDMRKNAHEEA